MTTRSHAEQYSLSGYMSGHEPSKGVQPGIKAREEDKKEKKQWLKIGHVCLFTGRFEIVLFCS